MRVAELLVQHFKRDAFKALVAVRPFLVRKMQPVSTTTMAPQLDAAQRRFDRNFNLNIVESKARRYVYFGLEFGIWSLDYFNILAFAFLESLTMHNAVKITVSSQLPLTTSRTKDQGNPPSFDKNHIIAFRG